MNEPNGSDEGLARIVPLCGRPTVLPRTGKQEVHVQVPGASSADLREWAGRIEAGNPISCDGDQPTAGLLVTDHPFMGVELTLYARSEQLLVLTLFADRATDEEQAIMSDEVER